MKALGIVAAAALMIMVHSAPAAILEVGKDGEAKASDLRGAILDAQEGDTVLVYPGTYEEAYAIINGKNITLKSVAGPEKTILDGGALNQILTCKKVSRETVIEGFTFRRGMTKRYGGAINVAQKSKPTIRNNIFEACEAGIGGAIYLSPRADALVENNLFIKNIAGSWGGALYAQVSSPVIRNNTFAGNNSEQMGSAVAFHQCTGEITGNIFADQLGLATILLMNKNCKPEITCNGFWNNAGEIIGVDQGAPLLADSKMSTKDPLFSDTESYGLSPKSPYLTNGDCGRLGWR